MIDRFLALSAWNDDVGAIETFATDADRKLEIDRQSAAIRQGLVRDETGLLIEAAFAISSPVQIAVLLGRAPVDAYEVVRRICDSFGSDDRIRFIAPFSDEDAWNSLAVSAARRIKSLSTFDVYGVEQFSRATAVADACRRLLAMGHAIGISSFGPHLEPESFKAICEEIDALVKRVSGRTVIDRILDCYRMSGRVHHGSLLSGRRVSGAILNARFPSEPLHFLYNLAWKHFSVVPTSRDPAGDHKRLTELARDLAAVLDTEAYNPYDGMSLSLANLHGSLADKILYDELFAFQQWQPTVAPTIFAGWLRHMQSVGCVFPVGSVDEWTEFGTLLMARAQIAGLAFVTPFDASSATLPARRAAAFFEACRIPVEQLNQGYLTPHDTSQRNAPSYPIYQISEGLYVLPPRAIVGRALFERVFTLLREARVHDLKNLMGKALELLTVDAVALTNGRTTAESRKYKRDGQKKGESPPEIDVASETDARLYLFECKSKALTNAARGGNSLNALADFARALLRPLIQANGHEIQLRSGGIRFLDGGGIDLAGREIDRIAVSMTDHGSMQDRTFLRAFVSSLWGARLTAQDPTLRAQLDEFNDKYLLRIQQGIDAICELSNGPKERFVRMYLHGCYWLSIDQLYYLCRRSSDLREALSPLRSITFGTGDMMAELAAYDRMRKTA
ncbi:hypothetical protein [Bradyrhizobium sp. NAS96.2]|uniref:hypothetical protein n=1 Tax=Bradyrhizobium sp. NAS96.2 TaxID=1680160 RepID=UPI00116122AB|nr:hypothetical protein [Bradyrhizobium sp. NAS96.2]